MSNYQVQLGDYVIDIENEEQFEAVIAKWQDLYKNYSECRADYSIYEDCQDCDPVLTLDIEGDILVVPDTSTYIVRKVSVKDIVPELFKSKPISPDDELTFTVNAKEWAKTYAILGKANGTDNGDLWGKLRKTFDKDLKKYDYFKPLLNFKSIDYVKIEKEWLELIFKEHYNYNEVETKKKTIQEKIDALQKELESL